MAKIINSSQIKTRNPNFKGGQIALASEMNDAFNNVLDDIVALNNAGASTSAINAEIDAAVKQANTPTLPSFSVPKLDGLTFYVEGNGLRWTGSYAGNKGKVWWKGNYWYITENTSSSSTNEEFASYNFSIASPPDVGTDIALTVGSTPEAIGTGAAGQANHRYYFAIKSGSTSEWNLSVIESAEVINASMITAGTINPSRIGTNSLAVGTLNTTAQERLFTNKTNRTSIEAWQHSSDATSIDGGKIYTGSVSAAKIDLLDLFSQDAMVGSTGAISNDIGGSVARGYNETTSGGVVPGFFLGYSTVPTIDGYCFQVQDSNGYGVSFDPSDGFGITMPATAMTFVRAWDQPDGSHVSNVTTSEVWENKMSGLIHFAEDPDTTNHSVEVHGTYTFKNSSDSDYDLTIYLGKFVNAAGGVDGSGGTLTVDEFSTLDWVATIPANADNAQVSIKEVWKSSGGNFTQAFYTGSAVSYAKIVDAELAFSGPSNNEITITGASGMNVFTQHELIYVHAPGIATNSGYYYISGTTTTTNLNSCKKIGSRFEDISLSGSNPVGGGASTVSIYQAIGIIPRFEATVGTGNNNVVGHLELKRTRE